MKKTIILFVVILGVLFVGLSLVDTSDYKLEKKLWQAQKQFKEIEQDPKAVPDQNYEDLIAQYRKILKQHPEAVLSRKIHNKIGKIYILKKDYVKARSSFQETISQYPDDYESHAKSLILIGQSFEMEKKYDEAVQAYRRLMNDYGTTDLGVNIPLYIMHLYVKLNKQEDAKRALQDALTFYSNKVQANPGTEIAFKSKRLLAASYFAKRDVKNGIATLGGLLTEYADSEYLTSQQMVLTVKTINTMSVANLKDFDTPIAIYQDFLNQHPTHKYNGYLQQTINGLRALKDKGVDVRLQPVVKKKPNVQ